MEFGGYLTNDVSFVEGYNKREPTCSDHNITSDTTDSNFLFIPHGKNSRRTLQIAIPFEYYLCRRNES